MIRTVVRKGLVSSYPQLQTACELLDRLETREAELLHESSFEQKFLRFHTHTHISQLACVRFTVSARGALSEQQIDTLKQQIKDWKAAQRGLYRLKPVLPTIPLLALVVFNSLSLTLFSLLCV